MQQVRPLPSKRASYGITSASAVFVLVISDQSSWAENWTDLLKMSLRAFADSNRYFQNVDAQLKHVKDRRKNS